MPYLGKVQVGVETVHGTAVAATKLLPIVQKSLPIDRKVTPIAYDLGVNADVTGSLVQGRLVEDTLSWDEGAFQLLPYLFAAGIKGPGTGPVEQTTDQGDYLWDGEPSLTADNSLKSLTLQRGDNQQAYIHAYAMFKRIHLSGQIDQAGGASLVKIEADYFAKENATGVFTASLAALPLTYMSAKLTQIYLDTAWADLGETELENILRSFDLDILTGTYPDFNGGDAETFGAHDQGPISFMLSLTLKRGAITEALRAATGQMRFCRLDINGPAIGSGENHLARFDLAGVVEDVVPMASNDRQKSANLDTLVLQGQYDPTSGKLLAPSVITDLVSL